MEAKERSLAEDSQSAKEKALILLRAALSKKAYKPVLLRLVGITPLADFFLILSARSSKHARAVAEAVLERSYIEGYKPVSSEGLSQSTWILLDLGDVIVHIFHAPARDFYDLEGLWRDAPREGFPEDLVREIEQTDASQEDDDDLW